jgi:hypothetical protein
MAFVVGAELFACLYDREAGKYFGKSLGTITAVTRFGVLCGGVHFGPEDVVFGSRAEAEAAADERNAAKPPTEAPNPPGT